MFSRNHGKAATPVKTWIQFAPGASKWVESFHQNQGSGQQRTVRGVFRELSRCRGVVIPLSSFTLALLILSLPASAGRKISQDGQGKAESAKSASVQRGKKLFTHYGCYECHGRAAQGGTGPRLGPDPLPLSVFLQFVRHPPTKMPPMPPFTAKVASDQDLRDIYAFLSSLPEPPKLKDIPLLNQ
jgi:mono/diheme cytochrome c family protein